MKSTLFRAKASVAVLGLIGSLTALGGCTGDSNSTPPNPVVTTRFLQTNLVSDIAGVATTTDPDLTNPWGIAFGPTSPFWISDNHSGKSTLYNGSGAKQALIVNIPTPTANTGGAPTGQVFNGTTDFKLPNGNPAAFIFATEDGTIVGWNGTSGTQAVKVADRSGIPVGGGAVYKGLAIGSNATGNFLYATNFRTGQVDVFDKSFGIVQLSGSFSDPMVPSGFAPFGIQNIGGDIFVTYAKQDADKHDDVSGVGNGLVDQFDSNGNLKRRLVVGSAVGGNMSALNSPWGLALAPASFGQFGNALLVGNFGDGHVNAFNLTTGDYMGLMPNNTGSGPITIPGLWGLTFGNGAGGSSTTTLYFTAGIGDAPSFTTNLETHGLFGSLSVVP